MTEISFREAVPSAPQATAAFLLLLLIVVLILSRLVPPFQSPDEFNHLKRAYLLSRGQVFLETTEGQSGGAIDGGLLDYMNMFGRMPFSYEAKVTQKLLRDSKSIAWTDE